MESMRYLLIANIRHTAYDWIASLPNFVKFRVGFDYSYAWDRSLLLRQIDRNINICWSTPRVALKPGFEDKLRTEQNFQSQVEMSFARASCFRGVTSAEWWRIDLRGGQTKWNPCS